MDALSGSFSPGLAASGYHAPLAVALPIIALVVLGRIAFAKVRGRPGVVGKVVVRCGKGHVFATVWSPFASLTSVRLGFARFQRCPIGNHWALVKLVNEVDLTEDERRALKQDGT